MTGAEEMLTERQANAAIDAVLKTGRHLQEVGVEALVDGRWIDGFLIPEHRHFIKGLTEERRQRLAKEWPGMAEFVDQLLRGE